MKERGMIFNGEMVRAILDGRKTQTRRPVKPQPNEAWARPPAWVDTQGYWHTGCGAGPSGSFLGSKSELKCPYGVPGDRLYVRETFRECDDETLGTCCEYKVDGYKHKPKFPTIRDGWQWEQCSIAIDAKNWRPSIHMPKWASRILLEITDVRVERVRDISFADCRAEGMDTGFKIEAPYCDEQSCNGIHRGEMYHFLHVWDSIYADLGMGWEENPWVWVIEFKVIEK